MPLFTQFVYTSKNTHRLTGWNCSLPFKLSERTGSVIKIPPGVFSRSSPHNGTREVRGGSGRRGRSTLIFLTSQQLSLVSSLPPGCTPSLSTTTADLPGTRYNLLINKLRRLRVLCKDMRMSGGLGLIEGCGFYTKCTFRQKKKMTGRFKCQGLLVSQKILDD